ncbi:MAG: 2-oxo-4-hydroxy-4-carboxy-5-ureidoimidazoline decarboxylase [Acidobacteriota bacterium]
MSGSLELINQADVLEAESIFRDCCGSMRWASRMAASRPFISEVALIETAGNIWKDLETTDRLEAFSTHPQIGENKAAPAQQARSAEWSTGEQAGMNIADEQLKQSLAAANRAYYEKFGFIFIVCATEKSASEMLELCRGRLANDREIEIMIAAGEQQKITEIRLRKLCGGP